MHMIHSVIRGMNKAVSAKQSGLLSDLEGRPRGPNGAQPTVKVYETARSKVT